MVYDSFLPPCEAHSTFYASEVTMIEPSLSITTKGTPTLFSLDPIQTTLRTTYMLGKIEIDFWYTHIFFLLTLPWFSLVEAKPNMRLCRLYVL